MFFFFFLLSNDHEILYYAYQQRIFTKTVYIYKILTILHLPSPLHPFPLTHAAFSGSYFTVHVKRRGSHWTWDIFRPEFTPHRVVFQPLPLSTLYFGKKRMYSTNLILSFWENVIASGKQTAIRRELLQVSKIEMLFSSTFFLVLAAGKYARYMRKCGLKYCIRVVIVEGRRKGGIYMIFSPSKYRNAVYKRQAALELKFRT